VSTLEISNRRTALTVALLLTVLAASPVFAKNDYDRKDSDGDQVVVSGSRTGVAAVAAQYGLKISGELEREGVYAAVLESSGSGTAAEVLNLLHGDPRLVSVASVEIASLPDATQVVPAVEDLTVDLAKAGDFTTPCLGAGFSGLLWSGYADQTAVREISLHEAHLENGDCGAAVVAVIVTGVDPSHPLLQGALTGGYDFILEAAGVPSEWASLDLSTAAIVEDQLISIVEQSGDAVFQGEGVARLDLSTAAIVESSVATAFAGAEVPLYFGHGTMVAGLVRLAAPGAAIMPLRVFDAAGEGHVFDIVRAIYHAVDHGADVINMSFSVRRSSSALRQAVQYARHRGVVMVAAAGNQGDSSLIYPAAYTDVIAVAALQGEELSAFSNYGNNIVDLAAPGSGVVSAFPGGLYGAGWGTSFSAPLVAGTAALLVHGYPEKTIATIQEMENDLRLGSERLDSLTGLIGSGRLDVLGAVLEVRE
jgi:subtilisin family serine protease